MKITVLHGDHRTASRQRLVKIIEGVGERGWEVIKVNPKSKLSISEVLVSDSLFSKNKLVVVEDLSKLSERDLTWLKNNIKTEANLLLWHKSKVGAKVRNALKDARFEEFDLPRKIFSLMDSFYPGNLKLSLRLLHEVLVKEPVEFVFALMARQMRDMYWVLVDPKTVVYPGWRVSKIKRQAEKYEANGLLKLIERLAKMDVESKTGGMKLDVSLDLALTHYLQ